jgi:hypothetical protein
MGAVNGNSVSVNDVYFSDVSSVKSAGSDLSGVRNGLGSADGSLKVTNVTDGDRMYDLYDKISKLIESYGKMVEHDAENFRQAGENQQITDRAYGGH